VRITDTSDQVVREDRTLVVLHNLADTAATASVRLPRYGSLWLRPQGP
jgi:hypothetical protein